MGTSQRLFDLRVQQHRAWLDGLDRGVRADFTGRTFKGINASNNNLTNAIFNGVKLFSCDFTCANLTDITAKGLCCVDTNFTNATFKNALMPRAEFTETIFSKTDLWNVSGDGVYIISLQLGGSNVCYTSEILQINCLRFDIKEIWWMTDDEVLSWVTEHTDEEKAEMAKWWHKWKYHIYQISSDCPAKPTNIPK